MSQSFISALTTALAELLSRFSKQPQKLVSARGQDKAIAYNTPLDTETSATESITKEIRASRQFSIAEAIGREGGSFLKGESSIPRPVRAAAAVQQFINTHSIQPTGVLSTTLCTWVCNDIRLSRQLDTPLVALLQVVDSLLLGSTAFVEFGRQVAIAHSKETGDRPYFQAINQPPHPDAHYSHHRIKTELAQLQTILQAHLENFSDENSNQGFSNQQLAKTKE